MSSNIECTNFGCCPLAAKLNAADDRIAELEAERDQAFSQIGEMGAKIQDLSARKNFLALRLQDISEAVHSLRSSEEPLIVQDAARDEVFLTLDLLCDEFPVSPPIDTGKALREALEAERRWIPVNEKLPTEDTWVEFWHVIHNCVITAKLVIDNPDLSYDCAWLEKTLARTWPLHAAEFWRECSSPPIDTGSEV
jgi:hypothetical protein